MTLRVVTSSNPQAEKFTYDVLMYARIVSVYRNISTVENVSPGALFVLFQITSGLVVGQNVSLYVPTRIAYTRLS